MKELISLKLQAVARQEQILLIFFPHTHYYSHSQSLSAEFITNYTKAGFTMHCTRARTHTPTHLHADTYTATGAYTRTHTHTDNDQLGLMCCRNGFREGRMRLLSTQRGRKYLPQIDFSFCLMISLSPGISV